MLINTFSLQTQHFYYSGITLSNKKIIDKTLFDKTLLIKLKKNY